MQRQHDKAEEFTYKILTEAGISSNADSSRPNRHRPCLGVEAVHSEARKRCKSRLSRDHVKLLESRECPWLLYMEQGKHCKATRLTYQIDIIEFRSDPDRERAHPNEDQRNFRNLSVTSSDMANIHIQLQGLCFFSCCVRSTWSRSPTTHLRPRWTCVKALTMMETSNHVCGISFPVHSSMMLSGTFLTSTWICSNPRTLCSAPQFLNHITLSPASVSASSCCNLSTKVARTNASISCLDSGVVKPVSGCVGIRAFDHTIKCVRSGSKDP